MFSTGWSAGIARVLTRDDAIRVRYDGKASEGYLASPYRNVRFGDWTTTVNGSHQVIFAHTIGSVDGLPEHLPQSRVSHAAVLEWVHSLWLGVGLHPSLRVGHDSFGIDSLTAQMDLRIAKPGWRMNLGYRYYRQSKADFFQSKYTMDPSAYSFYTSDKELGSQSGHLVGLDIADVLFDAANTGDTRVVLKLHADVFRYAYPGFLLLPSRTSTFLEVSLAWEL
jgi:hypothetical protein